MATNIAKPGDVKVEVKDTVEDVDFSKISIEEAFKILGADHHGLTTPEAEKRLQEYGPNKLPESTRNPILVFLGYMWNPLSWAMEAAAILSIILLDYADFALIVALLLLNSCISYYEESNADKAIKALAAALAPKAKVLRDGVVKTMEAVHLVPGDVLIMKFGDIVPADVKILAEEGAQGEEVPMQIDQAALTGESLPVKKFSGDVAFSGSAVKQGERHCLVYATGVNTFFGRAASLIASTNNVANIQKVMTKIGACCLVTIFVWVLIELAVQFGHHTHDCVMGEEGCPTVVNILVIIVGGIPIAMPTVLSVTLALGAYKLAKEGAIVARMSAVEEMAGMDVLCSDKTGTLTLNKLSIETSSIYCPSGHSVMEALKYGALSTNIVTEEPIDMVLYNSYPEVASLKDNYKTVRFIPFNPVDKFTCATVVELNTGRTFRLMKGSPQVVLKKSHNAAEISAAVHGKIEEFANRGFRSLGLAMAEGDGADGNNKFTMVAMIPLFDPPRHDTKSTIERCVKQGIQVKMITGDHLLIGKETARQLGMGDQMFPSETLIKARNGDKEALGNYANASDMVEKANGFAEVFPEHKFEIVEILQLNDHVVGMTGDGVNDAPALKKADVGIAVSGATDAARGAADIVLTAEGLSTIVTAVIGARKIFQRMTTYSKYTVSMTFRICFTFGLLTVIYDWYFPTLLIVILAVFNDGAMIALSKDRVQPSKLPNSWNLKNIFIMGIVYGLYLTLSTWVLFAVASKTSFFEERCGLFSLDSRENKLEGWCRGELAEMNLNPSTLICDYEPYQDQLKGHTCDAADTLLSQCMTEQHYVRGAMLRTLIYLQVSISGQALVFVVRNQGWSLMERAGNSTYIAFFAAQLGATIIALFGFNAYVPPRERLEDCQFCSLSSGGPVRFFSGTVPITDTESDFTASIIGCTGYVIVAWIWSAGWYVVLDPIKWALCWLLNEDGFRDAPAWRRETKHRLERASRDEPKELDVAGMVPATYANPLGRASISKPVSAVLDRASAAIVPVARTSGGLTRVSNDPTHIRDIARRSLVSNVARQSPSSAAIATVKEEARNGADQV